MRNIFLDATVLATVLGTAALAFQWMGGLTLRKIEAGQHPGPQALPAQPSGRAQAPA